MADFEFDSSFTFDLEEEKTDLSKQPKKRVEVQHRSKVMAIIGERFDCLIESSANVNTNPRSENTVLTVDRQLVADYVDLFNGIQSFNRDLPDAGPYIIPEDRSIKRGDRP